ncbi:MAG: PilC/PilY family type IV pilus protein [Thermodesulfobacteriota bacterium]
MERTKSRILRASCVALLVLFVVSLACLAWAGVYNKCRVPPIVASVEKPNVMMLIDFSGSMQFGPYWGPDTSGNWGGYYSTTKVANLYDESYSAETIASYDKYWDYYGFFDSGSYYKYNSTGDYFEKAAPDGPVATQIRSYSLKETKIEIQDYSTAGGAKLYYAYFKYTIPSLGTALAVNDCVFIQDVDQQATLFNKKAFKVLEAGTDATTSDPYFKVAFTPSRDGDPPTTDYIVCTGSATTRVIGTFTNGISGNFLNFAGMSRMDNTLTALIGGKATCSSNYCLIRGQGARRNCKENSYLNVDIYTRAGDYTSSTDWRPNAYDEGNHYRDKWSFLSVSAHYYGKVNSLDPVGTTPRNTEVWTFSMARRTRVFIEVRSTHPTKASKLRLFSGSTPATGTLLGEWTANGVFGSPRYSKAVYDSKNGYLLDAGNYSIEVTSDVDLGSDEMPYILAISADATKDSSNPNHNGQVLNSADGMPTGAFTCGRVALRKEEADRTGIIQETFPRVRYGFAAYQTDMNGKIYVGCHNTDMDLLVNSLQSTATATDDLFPYNGTPTGEAMAQMSKYFKQESSTLNSSFISLGNAVDPYYSSGGLTPCRRSFVLLISDGEWNGSQDPAKSAYAMHANDIRGDEALPGKQSVDVYTVYTYAQDITGQNSMKEIAMYGGFQDLDANKRPYVANRSYPDTDGNFAAGYDSRNTDWPLKGCSKCVTGAWCTNPCLDACCPLVHQCASSSGDCSTYSSCSTKFLDSAWAGPNGTYDPQCAEWAFQTMQQTVQDASAGTAIRTIYGEPRTYYYSSSGTEIAQALTAIIGQIESAHAAAGAVATVSQEIRGFDIVLRGVFQAVDEADPAISVWYGHLETYSPYDDGTYSFEKCCNEEKLCYQASDSSGCSGDPDCPSSKNCWDAAGNLPSHPGRRIFVGYDGNSDGRVAGPGRQGKVTWAADGQGTASGDVLVFHENNVSAFFNTSSSVNLLGLGVPNDCNSSGAVDTADATRIIEWIRGTADGLADSCYRSRDDTQNSSLKWLLGDIAYSTPVIVSPPSLGGVSQSDPNVVAYLTYRNSNIQRKKVVYVGANDGMVHAFLMGEWDTTENRWVYAANTDHPNIGKELWAYIPSNLLSEVKDLALKSYGNVGCKHRTMVDLSPQAFHVYIDPDGTGPLPRSWRTVLLGGERGGGDVYFALDVTDPDNPILLWEYSVLKNLIYYTAGTAGWEYNLGHCDETNRQNFCDRCTRSSCRPRRGSGLSWYEWCENRVNWCYVGPTPCDYRIACVNPFTGYKMAGFRNNYDAWKGMAFSWSRPTVGRFKSIDAANVTMYWGDPIAEGQTNQGSPTGAFPDTATGFTGDRHLAFIGGGFRYFDTQIDASTNANDLELLRQPYFMAIDVETGRNLFRYVWASLAKPAFASVADLFLLHTRDDGTYYVPHSLNDPLALDVLNKSNPAAIVVGDDAYVDHVYVGDMVGNFYGFKFNFETSTKKGIWVDIWLTKAVDESSTSLASKWSFFRSYGQPITVQPAASLDPDLASLRLVFGTGKYDDVITGNDDKSDPAKMSLYNLKDTLAQPNMDTDTGYGGEIIGGSGLYIRFNPKCGDPSASDRLDKFGSSCTWMKSTGVADCCEQDNASCSNPCWKCVYDLAFPVAGDAQCKWTVAGSTTPKDCKAGDPGERITSKALIAGKLIFVTSFLPPPDPCTFVGQGYLYIFHYSCSPFPDGFNPLTDPGDRLLAFYINKPGSTSDVLGLRLPLGSGMPSEPILDSSGKHVLIQMSTAEIKKIGVELLEKPFSFKGWRETTQESK